MDTAVIKQWIADLKDKDFGIAYNADYTCIVNDDGNIAGDAALFLAIRHADINDNMDVFDWYAKLPIPEGGYHPSECVVTLFTGIPLEDACKLMWQKDLYEADYNTEDMKAADFVKVLNAYLKTGEVDWKVLL